MAPGDFSFFANSFAMYHDLFSKKCLPLHQGLCRIGINPIGVTFGDTTYVWGVFANRIVAVQLIGKTVRFSYLLGVDERSGKNFDHRKRRLEEKLKKLAANFGIDLTVFFRMSNHSSSAQVTPRRRCDLGRGPHVPL